MLKDVFQNKISTYLKAFIYFGFFVISSQTSFASQDVQQPQSVSVEKIKKENVQIWKNFSGRLSAVQYAEIQPQVSGIITEVHFEEGQTVNKDDLLFSIDPRPFQAIVDQNQAQLDAAQTQLKVLQKDFDRSRGLLDIKAISTKTFEQRESDLLIAKANVKQAEALLEQAKINLDYALIKAPFSGKTSRIEIKKGNLVQAGPTAPLLTSIVHDKGIYADFDVDENTFLNILSSTNFSKNEKNIPVTIELKNGSNKIEGYLSSLDNQINPSTGTIRARAYFENSKTQLLPGMYALVRLGTSQDTEQILIPETAVGTDQDRKFVYVVDENNTTTYREVKLGERIKNKRVVLSGLDEDELVIIDGLIKIRPDTPVDPQMGSE